MATTLNFRDELTLPEWRVLSAPIAGGATNAGITSGTFFAEDLRNNDYSHPLVYFNTATTSHKVYNKKNDAWYEINSAMSMGGTWGIGACNIFVPSFSPRGTIAAGATTTKLTLTTALPASVAINQLANRGDGKGFIIRIIDNAAGATGKTEERRVIANTSGTTPTITLDAPLSFAPTTASGYEFLSGSYLILGTGALAANQFRRYDCLTSSYSSLSTTSLIATVPITANFFVPLDEQHVPYTRMVGEGMIVGASTYGSSANQNLAGTVNGALYCLLATGSAAGTLTGQAAAGDAAVIANQYRNYQIRIVEDTAIPTAVGQRRRITSHTAGASPIYTLASNWTVTPSTTCKYVIENDSDRILFFAGGTTTIYNYYHRNLANTAATENTWDTTSWAARGSSAQAAGAFGFHAFGVMADEQNAMKSSNIVMFRGGTTTTPDILDISGASTGSWTNAATIVDFGGSSYDTISATDVNHFAYNPHSQNGKYMYMSCNGLATSQTQRSMARIDIVALRFEKFAGMKAVTGQNTISGGRLAWVSLFQDGATKLAFYNTQKPFSAGFNEFWQLMLCR
jgi:hypothetical protein